MVELLVRPWCAASLRLLVTSLIREQESVWRYFIVTRRVVDTVTVTAGEQTLQYLTNPIQLANWHIATVVDDAKGSLSSSTKQDY